MPHIRVQKHGFLILPDEGQRSHAASLSKSLGQFSLKENFADVVFHCKNKTMFKANKLVLGYSSKLLGQLFTSTCDLPPYLNFTYDIICPGFEPEAMKRILEILYTGETFLNSGDHKLYKEMKSILAALEISMTLPDLAPQAAIPETFLGIKQEPMDASEIGNLVIDEVFQPLLCSHCDEGFQHPEDLEKHLKKHSIDVEEIDLEAETSDETTSSSVSEDSAISVEKSSDKLKRKSSGASSTGRGNRKKPRKSDVSVTSSEVDGSLVGVEKSHHQESTTSISGSDKKAAKTSQDRPSSASGTLRPTVRYYQCFKCSTVIGHYSNLLYHLATNHFADETKKHYGEGWKCEICSDENPSEGQLIRHLITKHNSLESLIPSRAEIEKDSFLQSKPAKSEDKAVKNERISERKTDDNDGQGFKCNICNAEIRHYRNLLVHLALVHYRDELKSKYGEKEWECGICQAMFEAERNLLSHLANRHSDFEGMLPPKMSFKNSKFTGVRGLKSKRLKFSVKKEKTDGPSRRFRCSECSSKCVRYPDLIVHIAMIHHRPEILTLFTKNDDKWCCNLCPKVLASEKSLIYHALTSHKALAEYMPSSESFGVKATPSSSSIAFKKKKKLKKVLKVKKEVAEDGNALPDKEEFVCELCNAVTSSKASLGRHMAWAHFREELKSIFAKSETECKVCDVKTKDELSLMRHIAGVHDGLREITKAKKSVKSEAQANQMSPVPSETTE